MLNEQKAILMVSFGTSHNQSREAAIGSLEKAVEREFPDYDVRRAFTSQMIIDKLMQRDGVRIDNVKEAMQRLLADNITDVVVQPTHVINGYEYDKMVEAVMPYRGRFSTIKWGRPLLGSRKDYEEVVKLLAQETARYSTEKTAVIYIGHGTGHAAGAAYESLGVCFKEAGYGNHFIGAVEQTPSLEHVVELVGEGSYEKVVLFPLMIVAGDHAFNDIAGDNRDSWKSTFQAKNYEVKCVLKGLGEYPGIQKIFTEHVADAVKGL